MKNTYESPEAEILSLLNADIVNTSGGDGRGEIVTPWLPIN